MRVNLTGHNPVPDDDIRRNILRSAVRRLRSPQEAIGVWKTSPRLAVVAGGPSVERQIEALLKWPGDIWAVNESARWCHELGINAVLFVQDPLPGMASCAKGVKRAIVGDACDRSLYDALTQEDAIVRRFKNDKHRGSSAVTAAITIGFECGYTEITLFGCEQCFQPGRSHVYHHEKTESLMAVECGTKGYSYLTTPQFYAQAIELASVIREYGERVKEESGGLLRAMVRNPDHNVFAVNGGLAEQFKAQIERKQCNGTPG